MADGRDDIGTTVSAFCPVSWSPPLVLVSLIADSYPAEVLRRVDRFAVTVLRASQRTLAGRFAVAGRPGARLLLDDTPHARGELSGALIPSGGLTALECAAVQRIPAGDHLLVIASVLAVPYVSDASDPLIRFAGLPLPGTGLILSSPGARRNLPVSPPPVDRAVESSVEKRLSRGTTRG